MEYAKPIPGYLVQRFKGWKATTYADNKSWYSCLAENGQHPRAMVISCCDSRVHVTSIFGADQGEFFIHRNIANLVPPHAEDGAAHGTSAAVEFAVTALKVAHIIVIGHGHCSGVKACIDMCAGRAPDLESKSSYLGRWMDILKPGYERVKDIADKNEQQLALEKETVLISLENLMTFPFIAGLVEVGKLTLHGLWHEIGEGTLEQYNTALRAFVSL